MFAGENELSRTWTVIVLRGASTRASTRSVRGGGGDTGREPDRGERHHDEDAHPARSRRAAHHVAGTSKVRASSTSVRTPKPVPPFVM